MQESNPPPDHWGIEDWLELAFAIVVLAGMVFCTVLTHAKAEPWSYSGIHVDDRDARPRHRHRFASRPMPLQPGTEGTEKCNHGPRCVYLSANGIDVGVTLIADGMAQALAKAYRPACNRVSTSSIADEISV